jgi:hypothetical protein
MVFLSEAVPDSTIQIAINKFVESAQPTIVASLESSNHGNVKLHEQRYSRVPLVESQNSNNESKQKSWWYAHFDGKVEVFCFMLHLQFTFVLSTGNWIARQMNVHPNRVLTLLVAGKAQYYSFLTTPRKYRLSFYRKR